MGGPGIYPKVFFAAIFNFQEKETVSVLLYLKDIFFETWKRSKWTFEKDFCTEKNKVQTEETHLLSNKSSVVNRNDGLKKTFVPKRKRFRKDFCS